MTILDLLCSVHDQQYIKVVNENPYSPFDYNIEGTAAYVIRAYDFSFYMQDIKKIKPVVFNNKLALEVHCW